MNHNENIIAIRKKSSSNARSEFAELMARTEAVMNAEAKKKAEVYKKLSPSAIETVSVEAIREACVNSPFDANEVKLVSGHRFPDIIANDYYGVEVKSTKSNHWTSTGSSIVESTRIESVEDIYMLFGKLGGDVPEFKCRPYGDVLYDIAVTHSPRYLINMELGKNETIFSKMNTTYDQFRILSDPIASVRKYYKEHPKGKTGQSMPWWITSDNVDKPHSFNIQMWSSLSSEEQKILLADCFILFPCVINPVSSPVKYTQITLWLCSYNQVLVPNVRDLFTAGGRITHVNGEALKNPIPHVFAKVIEHSQLIKDILDNADAEMRLLITEYNPGINVKSGLFDGWFMQVEKIAKKYDVPIRQWINNPPRFSFSKK